MPKLGTRLGSYEIHSVIGVGGMGEVYLARDTRLNRDVALKVLPETLAYDHDRAARLRHEARVLASLNHPNIATIHGLEESTDGICALVLEYVEGPTLSDLIAAPDLHDSGSGDKSAAGTYRVRRDSAAGRTLPMQTTLSIARQIADALEAAHEHQIVHRDLKPANVKVRPDGTTKVLDFGLAKAFAVPGTESSGSTLTFKSGEGQIAGTPAYMSPEQARGKAVDKRTDIWAFGCILYEMLTGRHPFASEHTADILAGILEREPDFSLLPETTPPAIRRLLRRSLEKDWKRRLPDIAMARIEIDDALTPEDTAARMAPARLAQKARWRERAAWLVATAAALALAVVAVLAFSRRPSDPALQRFEIHTPPTSDAFAFALSPDGRQLVFVATADGTPMLWVRPLDQVSAQRLTGTERASYPFWSADGRSLGFFAGGKLKRKDLAGGTPQVLADAPSPRGGAWNLEGDIVFAPEATVGLARVAATGGPVTKLTELASDQGAHRWPQFLPDGRRFLFFVGLGQEGARGVYLGSLDGETPQRVLASETAALFAPPNHLLRVIKDVLVVHRFDPGRGTADPMSRPVAQTVGTDDGTFHSAFSVSATGVLVHRPGVGTKRQLVWIDRAGTALATLGPVDDGVPAAPELGLGGRLALTRAPEGTGDIWVIDVERNVASRMTFDPGVDGFPVWSPEGDRLIFASGRNGRMDLFEKASAGVAAEQPLITSAHDKTPQDWSPMGTSLLYTDQDPATKSDLWVVPLEDTRRTDANARYKARQPVPVARSAFDEGQGRFSPDGRAIAYVSNETGRQEVYVQPFPSLSSKWKLSTEGGIYPRWHPNGRELFYLAPDMRLMAVPVDLKALPGSINPGVPRPLFMTRLATSGSYVFSAGIFAKAQYAVARDGRFLMIVAEDVTAPPITLVVNWAAGFTD
jgi:Tol biopolymer transport system component/tRNA A-37 threonylcarbamoyl transferase component Bud32